MSAHPYQFNEHRNLDRAELFFWIALDQTKKQLGFSDLAAAATFLLSLNDVPIPGKNREATAGTSVLSIFLRKVIDKRWTNGTRIPTLTLKSFCLNPRGLKFMYTTHLAAAVGRWIPYVDVVVFGYDATVIMYRTVKRYNAMVILEDRIFE